MKQNNMKVLLFGAIWCKDCKIMRPLWRNIRLEFPDLQVKYLDVDENEAYCKVFNIFNVPTAIFADKEGKELERLEGIQHKDTIIDLINKYSNL